VSGGRGKSRRPLAVVAALCGAALQPPLANAQAIDDDLVRPPRIDEAPHAARLAPRRAERDEALEEVVVIGGSEWRLPDLGSTWRAKREAEAEASRIEATLFPLYDPENNWRLETNLFPVNRELTRVGFIELFRVRFGRRPTE
jgi:hypothetical protein